MNLKRNLAYLYRLHGTKGLAKHLGVSVSSVSGYKTGKAKPSIDALNKISEFYEIGLDDLVNSDLELEATGHHSPAPLAQSDISPNFDPQKYIVKSVVRNEAKVEVLWRLMVESQKQSGKTTEQIQAETDRLFREAMERTREDMTGEE